MKEDPNEPILREEYERRHLALRDEYRAFARRSTRILAFIVAVVLATGGISAFVLAEHKQQTKAIEQSLVEGCRENGNPLRQVVRQFGFVLIGQIQKNIDQSQASEKAGVFREIFPSYPADKLHALLVENREGERADRRELRGAVDLAGPVACEEPHSSG